MEPIDAATISEIRGHLAGNLPHSCVIQNDVGVSVDGAHRADWQDTMTVPCMLSPLGGSEGFRQDQSSIKATWQVRFLAETPVSERNRLVVTGRDPVSGVGFGKILIPTSVGGAGRYGEVARIVLARDATPAEL